MSCRRFFSCQLKLLWRFLGFFQPSGLRVLHAMTVVLVILQLLTGMEAHVGPVYKGIIRAVCTDWHIIAGLIVLVVSQALVVGSLQHRGLRALFPYVWGDVAQLREDVAATLHGKLVPPRPGGLAACVQGLGLGALLLAVYTGTAWFVAWMLELPVTRPLIELHKTVVPLLAIYAFGHGGMALLHFIFWQRKVRKSS